MAKLASFFLLLLLFFSVPYSMAESPSASSFIKASCRATRYPALCVQCLSGYADKIHRSERQLAEAALSVSLVRARSAAAFVSRMVKAPGLSPRAYQAVRDCVENMGDSVDELGRSIRELGRMGRGASNRQEFMWHVSNVQTWVSAALTDENTCVDGFQGINNNAPMSGNVKTAIKSRVTHVAQVTSNALALVNRFASKHRPGSNIMP